MLLFPVALLLPLRWVDPWFTGVQVQRRVESWFAAGRYEKRYKPVEIARISPHLRHAVVAAEDGRFYRHWGIDWVEMWRAAEKGMESRKSLRGASTITQQLVKNLFFTTQWNPVRKGAVCGVVSLLGVLGGRGVWGAVGGGGYHPGGGGGALSREQAARLAACLPAPRRRRPGAMRQYSGIILDRMGQMGW